jgi:hypothetical protein
MKTFTLAALTSAVLLAGDPRSARAEDSAMKNEEKTIRSIIFEMMED